MTRARSLLLGFVVAVLAGFAASACTSDDTTAESGPSAATSTTRAVPATPPDARSLTEFAAAADAVCIATVPKVNALEDPDGVGGNKALGLGRVVAGS